jgi:hypothetical protein
MKKIILIGSLVLACFASAYAHSGKHEGSSTFTKHFQETLFSIGGKGQVSIEVLLDDKEYKTGKDVIGIGIHDSHDEDVEDADLAVSVTGLAEPLKVKEKGGGLYLVPNTGFPKEGRWEMKIAVKKKKMDDSAVFVFPEALQSRLPSGKYDAERLKGK